MRCAALKGASPRSRARRRCPIRCRLSPAPRSKGREATARALPADGVLVGGVAALALACAGGFQWELRNCEPADPNGSYVTGKTGSPLSRLYCLGVPPIFLAVPFFARATFRAEVVTGKVWTFEQRQGIGLGLNTSVNVRMTLLRLEGGGLFVYNPIAPTRECLELVREVEDEIGERVECILLPTTTFEHKQFLRPFCEAFPRARVLVSPGQYSWPVNGLNAWKAGCARAEVLSDGDGEGVGGLPPGLEVRILDLPPVGLSTTVRFSEVALYHESSRVLLVCDAVMRLGPPPPSISRRDLEEWADDRNTAITGLRLLGLFGVREKWKERRGSSSNGASTSSPSTLTLGWQRMAMTSLYFGQADVLSPSASFEELASRKLVVPPVLGMLVYGPGGRDEDEVAAAVANWSESVAAWDFRTVIPAHFNVAEAGSADWRAAFEVWRGEESRAYPEEDVKCLGDVGEFLVRSKIIFEPANRPKRS